MDLIPDQHRYAGASRGGRTPRADFPARLLLTTSRSRGTGNYKTDNVDGEDSGNIVTWGERSHEKAKLQHEKLVVWVEVGNYMKYRQARLAAPLPARDAGPSPPF